MGKWVGINNVKALGLFPLLKAELETKVPSRFSTAQLMPPICLLCCSIFGSHMGEQALKHWESSFSPSALPGWLVTGNLFCGNIKLKFLLQKGSVSTVKYSALKTVREQGV